MTNNSQPTTSEVRAPQSTQPTCTETNFEQHTITKITDEPLLNKQVIIDNKSAKNDKEENVKKATRPPPTPPQVQPKKSRGIDIGRARKPQFATSYRIKKPPTSTIGTLDGDKDSIIGGLSMDTSCAYNKEL